VSVVAGPRLLAFAGSLRAGSFIERDGRFPNHGVSAVLKNAIDWASRPPNALDAKVAASFGASPGRLGTARSQQRLRLTLSALNVWVLPRTVLISSAREAFDESGQLKDARYARDLAALGRALANAAKAGVGRL
jgi:chromate reductase, NAD(P)H dehydrogenase (quinone)